MLSHALPRIGAIATVLLQAALPALAQDTAITGARVTLIEKPSGALAITLQNLRDAPLVAWELAVERPGAPRPEIVTATDFTRPFEHAAGGGPLSPSELRVLRIQASSLATDSQVVVRLAVFADGYYEGQRGSAEKFRQRRAWHANDVRFWLGALQLMPRSDDEGLRKFLRNQLARHAARRDSRQSIEAAHLRSLAFDDVPRAPGWVLSAVDRQLTGMREHLTRLEQPLKPGPESMGDHVNSVAAGTTGTPQGRFYAVVENLTDVPIEAFGLHYSSGTFMRSDLYSAAEARPGFGPIQPGERREVPVSLGHGDNPERPDVRLSFVLFADLRFEGLREQRDQLLRTRERRAADMTFTIATLSEAVQQPPDRIVEFLESKKRERAVAMAATREGPGFTGEIDEVIRLANSSPGQVLAHIGQINVRLVRDRASLTRHLAR